MWIPKYDGGGRTTFFQRILNPMNWGTKIYDLYSFDDAFAKSRLAGESEFMWRGKRYPTIMNNTKDPITADDLYDLFASDQRTGTISTTIRNGKEIALTRWLPLRPKNYQEYLRYGRYYYPKKVPLITHLADENGKYNDEYSEIRNNYLNGTYTLKPATFKGKTITAPQVNKRDAYNKARNITSLEAYRRQKLLRENGYDVTYDGYYGDKSNAAWEQYQAALARQQRNKEAAAMMSDMSKPRITVPQNTASPTTPIQNSEIQALTPKTPVKDYISEFKKGYTTDYYRDNVQPGITQEGLQMKENIAAAIPGILSRFSNLNLNNGRNQ